MSEYLVKRRHYSGGESVVAWRVTETAARALAASKNTEYQTDNYFVEPYEPAKVVGWGTMEERSGLGHR